MNAWDVLRAGFFVFAILAGSGAGLFLLRQETGLAVSLVALTGWLTVLALRPELAPFGSASHEALIRTRVIFASLGVIFFLLTAFGAALEAPRVFGPHFTGHVVAFDLAVPEPYRSAYPRVEFTDSTGQHRVISTWPAGYRGPRPGALLSSFRIGDTLPVVYYKRTYHGVIRNEYRVLGAVLGLPGAAFVLCATLALLAHYRLTGPVG